MPYRSLTITLPLCGQYSSPIFLMPDGYHLTYAMIGLSVT